MMATPESRLTLIISLDALNKTINWRSSYINPDDSDLERLQNVESAVQNIIQKEAEINITQPECRYV